jgi:hypothetical protein
MMSTSRHSATGNHDDPGFSSLSLKDLIEARDLSSGAISPLNRIHHC